MGERSFSSGPAGVAGGQRLLAVRDAELGQRGQRLERLLEAPCLVDVDLQRQVARDAAHRADALDVETVATAELQLEAPEPIECLLGAAGHVVGIAEPDRPARRRPGAAERRAAARRAGRGACPAGRAARRRAAARAANSRAGSRSITSSSANGSSPEQLGVLLDVRLRRLGRLVVVVDAAAPRRSPRRPECRTSTTTTSSLSRALREMTNVSASSSVTIRAETSTAGTYQRPTAGRLALPGASSSGDRARASGARGRRFDSCLAHFGQHG